MLRRIQIALFSATIALVAAPSLAQVLTNQDLIDAGVKAQTLLSQNEPSGTSFVLEADFFLKAFEATYTVNEMEFNKSEGKWVQAMNGSRPTEPAKTGLMGQTPIIVCIAVAETMLDVAKPDLPDPNDYLVNWKAKKEDLLARIQRVSNRPIFQTDMEQQAWRQFLENWQLAVMKADITRFRDALRQAAYSILRVGTDKEKAFFELVKKGLATPSGGGAGSGGLTTSQFNTGSYSGGTHGFHERWMNHIIHKNERRVSRITRIVSRR